MRHEALGRRQDCKFGMNRKSDPNTYIGRVSDRVLSAIWMSDAHSDGSVELSYAFLRGSIEEIRRKMPFRSVLVSGYVAEQLVGSKARLTCDKFPVTFCPLSLPLPSAFCPNYPPCNLLSQSCLYKLQSTWSTPMHFKLKVLQL